MYVYGFVKDISTFFIWNYATILKIQVLFNDEFITKQFMTCEKNLKYKTKLCLIWELKVLYVLHKVEKANSRLV